MTQETHRRAWMFAAFGCSLAAMALTAFGQTTQPGGTGGFGLAPSATSAPAPAPADPFEDFVKKTKNPVPWFKWGADLRLRDEYWHNEFGLSNREAAHDQHYQRYRGRWWSSIMPVKDVELFTRITWEGWNMCWPKNIGNANDPADPIHRGWLDERDEVLIDNLYLKLTNFLGLPLTIIGGRQDIMIGDGWWTGDGTPLDGSRTFYFDAIRAIYDIKEIKTTIDLTYLQNDAQGKAWIPKINDGEVPPLLEEQDEQGVIVYVTNKSIAKTEISPYFVYKHGEHEQFLNRWTGYNADIYMFGTRVAHEFTDHWKVRLDLAGQFGNRNIGGVKNQSICALGSNNRLSYFVNDAWKQEYFFEYEYLSGDDPDTRGTYEGFDTLWGRYPRWTEQGFLWTRESRNFDFTNLHRVGPGWSGKPLKNLELGLKYFFLFADQSPPGNLVTPAMFASGGFRGQMLIPYAKYTINDHMFIRAMPEFFFPGDFYARANNDPAMFWRFEINLTW